MLRRAFTLIELLVVVAIIALLISILLPALNKAGEVAKLVVCGTNQRQLGIAMLSYASESRDLLPYAHVIYPGGPGDEGATWLSFDDILMDYITPDTLTEVQRADRDGWFGPDHGIRVDLMVCPSDKVERPAATSPRTYMTMTAYQHTHHNSYAGQIYQGMFGKRDYRSYARPQAGQSEAGRQIKTSEAQRPGATVLTSEIAADYNRLGVYYFTPAQFVEGRGNHGQLDGFTTTGNNHTATLHDGILNWLHVDGHVERLRPAETVGEGSVTWPGGRWTRWADD